MTDIQLDPNLPLVSFEQAKSLMIDAPISMLRRQINQTQWSFTQTEDRALMCNVLFCATSIKAANVYSNGRLYGLLVMDYAGVTEYLVQTHSQAVSSVSRAYTPEEMRNQLLHKFLAIADYWAVQPGHTTAERCRRTVFTLLSTLDGNSPDIPSYNLVVNTDAERTADALEHGNNFYLEKAVVVSGSLHDAYGRLMRGEDSKEPTC